MPEENTCMLVLRNCCPFRKLPKATCSLQIYQMDSDLSETVSTLRSQGWCKPFGHGLSLSCYMSTLPHSGICTSDMPINLHPRSKIPRESEATSDYIQIPVFSIQPIRRRVRVERQSELSVRLPVLPENKRMMQREFRSKLMRC